MSGSAIPLQDPNSSEANGMENGHQSSSQHSSTCSSRHGSQGHAHGDNDDDIFELDEEQLVKSPPVEVVEEKSFVNGQVGL